MIFKQLNEFESLVTNSVFLPILPPLPHNPAPYKVKRVSQFVTKENKLITTALTFLAVSLPIFFGMLL